MGTLFHISETSGIERFDPRASPHVERPVVWAVNDEKLRNYLLPRDCPRVTFYAGANTTAEDRIRFLGDSSIVVAIESAWLDRVRSTTLYCYHFPDTTFACVDRNAGYFHSHDPVVPQHVEAIDDLLRALISRGVELRTLPSLWQLHDSVAASSLSYSMIRMRNAARTKAVCSLLVETTVPAA
jgi:hypothetical protein